MLVYPLPVAGGMVISCSHSITDKLRFTFESQSPTMSKMKRYRTVDEFVAARETWTQEVKKLREVLLSSGMDEAIKWGFPVYMHSGRNVAGLGAFKSYFGIWFYDGNLLSDPDKVLVNAQQGKTKSMRQWRMTSAKEIKVRKIKSYLKEAMMVADEATKSAKPNKRTPARTVAVPPELHGALKADKKAARAFGDLTPGRQRDYAEYIASAKREQTKLKRLQKIMPMIRQGVGLDSLYRRTK